MNTQTFLTGFEATEEQIEQTRINQLKHSLAQLSEDEREDRQEELNRIVNEEILELLENTFNEEYKNNSDELESYSTSLTESEWWLDEDRMKELREKHFEEWIEMSMEDFTQVVYDYVTTQGCLIRLSCWDGKEEIIYSVPAPELSVCSLEFIMNHPSVQEYLSDEVQEAIESETYYYITNENIMDYSESRSVAFELNPDDIENIYNDLRSRFLGR